MTGLSPDDIPLGEFTVVDMAPGSYRTPHTKVTTDTTIVLDAEIGDGGTFHLYETNIRHAFDGRGERYDEYSGVLAELLCIGPEAAAWLRDMLDEYLTARGAREDRNETTTRWAALAKWYLDPSQPQPPMPYMDEITSQAIDEQRGHDV